jgi:hypothetical protein
MNCLSFNCRGAGNAPIVRELTALSRSLSPSLFFLCETRQNKNKVRRLRRRLGLKGFVGLSSEGFSGALLFFGMKVCMSRSKE